MIHLHPLYMYACEFLIHGYKNNYCYRYVYSSNYYAIVWFKDMYLARFFRRCTWHVHECINCLLIFQVLLLGIDELTSIRNVELLKRELRVSSWWLGLYILCTCSKLIFILTVAIVLMHMLYFDWFLSVLLQPDWQSFGRHRFNRKHYSSCWCHSLSRCVIFTGIPSV